MQPGGRGRPGGGGRRNIRRGEKRGSVRSGGGGVGRAAGDDVGAKSRMACWVWGGMSMEEHMSAGMSAARRRGGKFEIRNSNDEIKPETGI